MSASGMILSGAGITRKIIRDWNKDNVVTHQAFLGNVGVEAAQMPHKTALRPTLRPQEH